MTTLVKRGEWEHIYSKELSELDNGIKEMCDYMRDNYEEFNEMTFKGHFRIEAENKKLNIYIINDDTIIEDIASYTASLFME